MYERQGLPEDVHCCPALLLSASKNTCTSHLFRRFVKALDIVARNLPLSSNQSSRRLVAPGLAIQSSRANPASFSGMSLSVKPPTADRNTLTRDSMVNKELPMADVQTSIKLPQVMFKDQAYAMKKVKIGFVIYQNDKFFQPVIPEDVETDANVVSVWSRIISSSVQGMTFENLTEPVELIFEPLSQKDADGGETVCSFWDFSAMGESSIFVLLFYDLYSLKENITDTRGKSKSVPQVCVLDWNASRLSLSCGPHT